MNVWILFLCWFLYFLLHSVLAAEAVKRYFSRLMGKAFRFYRLIYSCFSTTGLVFLLFLNGSIHSGYLFSREGLVRYLSLMLTTFGVMTIQIAFRQYRIKAFLGLDEESNELNTEGILKVVRHPIYSGIILVTVGFFLFIPNLPTLISCACILIYIPIGIYFEEKKLIRIFGETYREYRKKVPALIPGLY